MIVRVRREWVWIEGRFHILLLGNAPQGWRHTTRYIVIRHHTTQSCATRLKAYYVAQHICIYETHHSMRRTTQSTVYDTQQYVTQHTIQHTYMYETHHSQSHTANTAEHIIRAFVTHHSMLDSETDNTVQRQNALFSILPIIITNAHYHYRCMLQNSIVRTKCVLNNMRYGDMEQSDTVM